MSEAVYGVVVVGVVGAALLTLAAGVAWHLVAAFVLCGVVRSGLPLFGLDPLGLVLGTGEGNGLEPPRPSRRQGFGGGDAAIDLTGVPVAPPTERRRCPLRS